VLFSVHSLQGSAHLLQIFSLESEIKNPSGTLVSQVAKFLETGES